MNLIFQAIDPESWDLNGGTSTLGNFTKSVGNAEVALLVVSSPTSTHLKIQALLNRLNGHFGASIHPPDPLT